VSVTYSLSCTGAGGTTVSNAPVTVTPPTIARTAARFRFEALGTETQHSWVGALNAPLTIKNGQPEEDACVAWRSGVDCSGGTCPSAQYTPHYKKNGVGNFAPVPAICGDICYGESRFISAEVPTTEQLNGPESFVAGQVVETGTTIVAQTLQDGQETENLYILCFGVNAIGDTFELRLHDASTPLEAYATPGGVASLTIGHPQAIREGGGRVIGGAP
jgi:hypothetical protein